MDFCCCCIEYLNVDMKETMIFMCWITISRPTIEKPWLRWFCGDDELVSKLDSVASEVSTGSFPIKLDRSKYEY